MGGNGRGSRGTERSRGSGGGGSISTVDSSIAWDKIPPITETPASVNGDSARAVSPASVNGENSKPVIYSIGCATTTLNASSFKGCGAGASKAQTKNGYVIFVSPVVVMVTAAALYPPSPLVAGRRGFIVLSLELFMLMVATFMSPPPRSNFSTTKVLCLTDVVAFGPIYISKTMPMKIMFFLFAL